MIKKFVSYFVLFIACTLIFSNVCAYNTFATENVLDANSMLKTIETLSSLPRGTANKEIESARNFIVKKFEEYGLTVNVQEFESELFDYENNKYIAKNIIGTLRTNARPSTSDIFIICAHYDGADNFPAANDNASGIAVMLELVKVLHTIPTDTEIRFIAFDAEEKGLIGSSYYVDTIGDDIEKVVGIINFDMLAAQKEKTVRLYTADGSANYLFDILNEYDKGAKARVTWERSGISDHLPFFVKAIPHIFFSHPAVEGEYHTENDKMEHISPEMLMYAANAGQYIVKKIMDPKTPSYNLISKPILDDTVYEVTDNKCLFYAGRKDAYENATGIKLSHYPSSGRDTVYKARIKLFGISQPLILTAKTYPDYKNGVLSYFDVNMCEAGVDFEKLKQILTSKYDDPQTIKEDENGTVSYCWNNPNGDSYVVEFDISNGKYSFFIKNIQVEPEGYTIKNGELIRMKYDYGADTLIVSRKNNTISTNIIKNIPSNDLNVSENAKQAWSKLKVFLTDEEVNDIGFIRIYSKGLNNEMPIRFSYYSNEIEQAKTALNQIKENLEENTTRAVDAHFDGLLIDLDYICLLNPLGPIYSQKNIKKNLALARCTSIGSKDIPSTWAVDTVKAAINDGVLSPELAINYQKPISREDFCIIGYNLISDTIWEEKNQHNKSFNDTHNEKILALAKYGIINGRGEYNFAPQENILREEAAVILNRILELWLVQTPAIFSPQCYDDENNISSYAVSSVKVLKELSIMNGKDNNKFYPQETLTKEEAIVIFMRLLNVKNKNVY